MIKINNLTTNEIKEEFLEKVAKIVLKGKNGKEAGLSIILVGQERMRKLNKKYRGKNKVTDVLAFGQSQKFPIIPENKLDLGEIVICLYEVKKNAKRYNSTFKKELARVLIHGILHLLGYDHTKDEKAAKEMEVKQELYLSQVSF